MAGQPGGDSCAAVPGKDQVRVAVHEAGQNRPAADVDVAVAGALRYLARVPHPGHPAVDSHQGGLRPAPERAFAQGGIVADQQPDVVEDRRADSHGRAHGHARALIAALRAPATSPTRRCWPRGQGAGRIPPHR